MNFALWVAQALLAVVFLASGAVKSVGSKEWLLASGQTGLSAYSVPFIRFIAVCEILGAAGLIAPWATGIMPILTPLAAACLTVIMVGAANAHTKLARAHASDPPRRRKELLNVSTNAVLLAGCLFVVVGRAFRGSV
jgi:uncharacterized membrane protein YphA (DoxX/SURF4 family)